MSSTVPTDPFPSGSIRSADTSEVPKPKTDGGTVTDLDVPAIEARAKPLLFAGIFEVARSETGRRSIRELVLLSTFSLGFVAVMVAEIARGRVTFQEYITLAGAVLLGVNIERTRSQKRRDKKT